MAYKKPLYNAGDVRVTTKGSGRFRIVWTEAGRQKERSAPSLETAIEMCDAENERINTGQPDHRLATVADLTEAFLEAGLQGDFQKMWSDVTHDQLHSLLTCHLVSAEGAGLGETLCAKLSRIDTAAATQKMADSGYAPSTIKAFAKGGRRLISFAQDLGVYPPEKARQLRLGFRVPEQVELEAISEAAAGTAQVTSVPEAKEVQEFVSQMREMHGPYGTLLELVSTTGLRWEEVVALQKRDIDFLAATVSVRRARRRKKGGTFIGLPKSKSSVRTVRLTANVLEQLAKLCELKEDESWVFTTTRGKPISSASGFRRSWWAKAAEAAGYSWTFHDLRHYYATRQLAAGVPVASLAKALGHSSPRITLDVYVGHSSEALETSVATWAEEMS